MSNKEAFFSIVIPNWNGQHFLKKCLDSIDAQNYRNFEVIVVDNGSKDDSVEYIAKNYPDTIVEKLPKNIGFAPAVNIGIKKAKGNFIFLLNNDTELDRHFLTAMEEAESEFPDAGIFASKMLDFADHTIIDTCGDKMTWTGRSYKYGELKKDGEEFNQNYYIFGACAGASVYRKEVFEAIGLFDEDFFAYLEDVDIDFRSQLAGFKCVFVPKARVYHIGSATTGKRSPFGFGLMIKNHWHLIYKNFPTQQLILYLPKIFYSDFRFFLAAVRYGFTKDFFKGLFQAISQFPKMIPKRTEIQNNRKVSLTYLDSIVDKNFKYKSLSELINGRK